MTLIIILIIIGLVLVVGIGMYNGLVRANVRTEEAWSDITVQLKRRSDLIPNLVNTVKGYATHEQGVFEKVTAARANALSAQGVVQTAQAENQIQDALKSLFAVSEAYPDLKANENFKALQDELVDSEDKIQAARRFYNSAVRDLNIKIKSFPGNIISKSLGFGVKEFFELGEAEQTAVQKPVDVKF